MVSELPAGGSSTGAVVAEDLTDAQGAFRIAVAPDRYVLTADAGMSCEPVEVRVMKDRFTPVEIACDTGIR